MNSGRMFEGGPRRSPTGAIVDEELATDGYRTLSAFVRRRLGVAANRKRALRVMPERKLRGCHASRT